MAENILQLTVNTDTRRAVEATTLNTLRSTDIIRLIAGERPIIATTFVNKSGTAIAFAGGDTFEMNIDVDYTHDEYSGTLNSAYSGAVTSIAMTFGTTDMTGLLRDTGSLTLKDTSNPSNRESVDYTAVVISGSNNEIATFTVSKTLTNSYASGDYGAVQDRLMAQATEDDVNTGEWAAADKTLGLVSFRLDCRDVKFSEKLAAIGDGLEYQVKMEIKTYPSGSTIPIVLMQDTVYGRQTVRDLEAVTIPSDENWSAADSRYVAKVGVAGGQQFYGGTAAGEDVTINSTSHATKGYVILGNSSTGVVYDEVNDRLGIGAVPGAYTLDVTGTLNVSGNISTGGTVDGIDIATDVGANTTHRTSDGSDHTFIDQSVIAGASPEFASIIGGTGAGDDLTLTSTSNATKGSIILGSTSGAVFDEVNNRLSVGSTENTVTIGGTSYGSTLSAHAEGATDLAEFAVHRHSDTAGFGGHMVFARSRGTEAAETVVQSGDTVMRIDGLGHDGTDFEICAQIDFDIDGTPGAGDMPGRIVFLTTPDGSATPAERMRIDSSGNVGIGASSPSDFNVLVNVNHLVVGAGSANSGTTIYSGTASNGNLAFADGSVTAADEYRGLVQYAHSDNSMRLFTDATERMRIDSAGAVCIGATAPIGSEKLRVNGTLYTDIDVRVGNRLRFAPGDVEKSLIFDDGSSNMIFETAGAEKVRISSAGAVLIGATAPVGSEKLYVAGDVYATGSIRSVGFNTSLTLQNTSAGDVNQEFLNSSQQWNFRINSGSSNSFSIRDITGGSVDRLEILTGGNILLNQTSGAVCIGTTTADAKFQVEEDTALTATVNYNQRLTHTTSGTPAANIGVGIEFEQETSAGNNEVLATFEAIATDVTATSEDGAFVFKLMAAGAAATEHVRIDTTGIDLASGKVLKVNGTQVVTSQQTALTSTLTTVTHDAPGTPDYAYSGSVTNTSAYGLTSADEFNTMLSVIANLQTRVDELETKLQAHGLIA